MSDLTTLMDIVNSSDLGFDERLEAAFDLAVSSLGPVHVAQLLDILVELKDTLPSSERALRARLGQVTAILLRSQRQYAAAYREISECASLFAALEPDSRKLGLALLCETASDSGHEADAIERIRAVEREGGFAQFDIVLAFNTLLSATGRVEEALDKLRQARQTPGLRPPEIAELTRQIAVRLESSGRFAEALTEFQHAVRLLAAEPAPNRVAALTSLSNGYINMRRLDEAAQAADEAITAADADHVRIYPLLSRGNVCIASGQPRLAIDYFHRALVAEAKAGERRREIVLLNNIASCYLELGQVELSVMYRMWALDSCMELRDQPSKALALTALAGAYLPEEARVLLTEALQIYTELGDLHGQIYALFGLARACEHLADKDGKDYLIDDAGYFLKMARERVEATDDLALIGAVHAQSGQLAVRAHDAEKAWAYFESSWSAAESLRRLTMAESVRIQLGQEVLETVTSALDLALTSAAAVSPGDDDATRWHERFFSMVERNRARALIDRLANAAPAGLLLPANERATLSELAVQVRRRREQLAVGNHSDAAEASALRRELTVAHQRFNEYEAFLTQSFLPYRLLESTEAVDGRLLDEHMGATIGLIEYVAVKDALVSVVRVQGRVALHQHGALAEITALDQELTDLCRNRASKGRTAELSQQLYRLLVSPIEVAGDLADITELIIVPAPQVFGFPIEALTNGDSPLFERFLVTYLPAASVAPFLAGLINDYEPALVLADPDGSLPHSRSEAAAIADLFQLSGEGRPLLGERATGAELSSNAASAGLIHIAAHADFDPMAPTFSSLRLAGGNGQSTGFEVRDVLDLQLRPCLVVLSGCETGLGSVEGANEMIGFMRALMVSGAAAIIASRWAVWDAATSEYMRIFYRALSYGEHPVVAMREARHDQIERNGYTHPGYWAPFTYFGLPPSWSPKPSRPILKDNSLE